MSESGRHACGPHSSDRFGPQCGEMSGGSINTTLRQDLRAAISAQRLGRPSANRKRLRSMSRVFHSVRGEFGLRALGPEITAMADDLFIDTRLTPLPRPNMTVASQSGRICRKARLTTRLTGKSPIL